MQGREPDAAWRAEAEARIEQHRMAPLKVRVTDAEGQPVEGAAVHAAMQQHAFGFGTVVSVRAWADRSADGAIYREKLENLAGDGRSFNIAVIENALKWEPWEDGWAGTHEQTVETVAWLHEKGMDVRGHNLLWPAWRWLPEDLEARQDDPAYLRQRIRDHIAEIVSYPGLQGELREWDVLNEPVHLKDLENILGDTAYAEWFRLAAEADPEARLFINEYGILSDAALDYDDQQAYQAVIRQIQEPTAGASTGSGCRCTRATRSPRPSASTLSWTPSLRLASPSPSPSTTRRALKKRRPPTTSATS